MPPPGQPDPTRARLIIVSDGNGSSLDQTDQLSLQHHQRVGDTSVDSRTTPRANITPPIEDVAPKRSASPQPTEEPDLKKLKLSTPSDDSGGVDGLDKTHLLSFQRPQQLVDTVIDNAATPSATTPQPTQDVDVTQKRPASAQPADEPDPKRTRVSSTPPPRNRRCAEIISKRRSLTQPTDQPDGNRARTVIPSDASGGNGGFKEAYNPPTPYASFAAKDHALAQRIDRSGLNGDMVFVPLNWRRGGDGFDETLSSFSREIGPALRASTEIPDEVSSKPRLAEKAGIEAKDQDGIGKDKNDKDKGKDQIDNSKFDSDSDDCKIVEERSSPATPKWKQSVAARLASAKRNEGKRSEQLRALDTEGGSLSTKKPAAKESNAGGNSATQAAEVNDSTTANNGSAEEDDDDDNDADTNESVCEDPEIAKNTISEADKTLSRVCRTCKMSANKVWKVKHDTTVSTLKQGHRAAIKALKDDAAAVLKKAKALADREKKAAKAKAEDEVEDVKDTWRERHNALKVKSEGEIKVLKKSVADEKSKVENLKLEVENTEKQRKKAEKDAADKVKTAEADLKAGKLRLKEESKQLKRESQIEINQSKPELSKVVKAKDKVIKEITQRVLSLEQELERSEEDVLHARALHSAEKSHHEHCQKQLKEAKSHGDDLTKQLRGVDKHCKGVQVRAQSDVARAEEEIITVKANLQKQSSRVVDRQRENYLLQDAMQTHAKLAEGRKVEIEKLKKQLREARAELDVALGMEGMDDGIVGDHEGEDGGVEEKTAGGSRAALEVEGVKGLVGGVGRGDDTKTA